MTDYYKDLWTKPNNHGTIFWRDVDFNKNEYKLQEHIFRQLLVSIKNLNRLHVDERKISSVLEVGAGTGRMTKIMLEEFLDDIIYYDIVDINKENLNKVMDNLGTEMALMTYPVVADITDEEFDISLRGKQYDIVLASEIFMHIKPEDIEMVLKRVIRLLAPKGLIINIDWFFEPNALSGGWCFIHDYHKMYEENGLTPLFTADMREIKQKMFCYQK